MKMQRLERPGCLQPVGVGVGGSQDHKGPLSPFQGACQGWDASCSVGTPKSVLLHLPEPHSLLSYPLMVQTVKNLPAMRKTWVRSLGREDFLEKEMTTHSSILAWRITWTEEPGGLQSMRSQRAGHN